MGTRMVSLDSEVELLPSSKFNPQSEHSRTLPCAELARKRTQHKVSLLPKGGYKPSTTNNNMPSTSLVDQDASEREVTEAENGSGEGKQSKRLEKVPLQLQVRRSGVYISDSCSFMICLIRSISRLSVDHAHCSVTAYSSDQPYLPFSIRRRQDLWAATNA